MKNASSPTPTARLIRVLCAARPNDLGMAAPLVTAREDVVFGALEVVEFAVTEAVGETTTEAEEPDGEPLEEVVEG